MLLRSPGLSAGDRTPPEFERRRRASIAQEAPNGSLRFTTVGGTRPPRICRGPAAPAGDSFHAGFPEFEGRVRLPTGRPGSTHRKA